MKKTEPKMLLVFVVALSFSACVTIEQHDDPSDELQNIWHEFAQSWNALDAQTCASFYAEDAVSIPPELAVRSGREDIQSFYEWLFSMHSSAEYRHQILSVSRSGNMAVERGSFSVNWTRNDGSTWIFNARSITQWEKDDEGRWMIKTFIFNAPPAE